MTIVRAKLFGTPKITIGNEQIFFSYGKAEALFYYLLLKKQVSREILVDLLWSNVDESLGKKSLRNAVYIIKKTFNEEVLISPQRTIIMLNPNIIYKIDIELFLNSKNSASIGYYKGEFLEGFYVNDANNFEQWMFNLKYTYKDMYIKKLYNEISICLKDRKTIDAEKYCKTLINTDPFDERAYRVLLNIYRKQGRYNECIYEYNKLERLLEKELSLQPDSKTKQLIESIVKEKNYEKRINRNRKKDFFYGRRNEIYYLNNEYERFINNIKSKSITVIGEAGVGKTKLVNRFLNSLDKNNINILSTNCYQAEKKALLKPWFEIANQLANIIDSENIKVPDMLKKIVGYVFPTFINYEDLKDTNPMEKVDYLKYQVAEKALLDILQQVSHNKKMIIFFEDIHWIDNMSLTLIKNILLQNKSSSIKFIITCRKGYSRNIENFLTEMGGYKLLKRLELRRFNKKETIEFAQSYLPDHKFNHKIKKVIYKETEGNPLFIMEFLNSIKENINSFSLTQQMQDVLKSRFLNISKDEKNILNIISIYFDRVTFKELFVITGKEELELSEILDKLKDRYLIEEFVTSNGEIAISFTHQKLREYIYEQLSLSKKMILHNRAGEYLEKQLKNDGTDKLLYSRLIYHFENSGNKISALRYKIIDLYGRLQFKEEIFPIIDYNNSFKDNNIFVTEEQSLEELQIIMETFENLKSQNHDEWEKLKDLELAYLHMVGRHHIISGEPQEGLLKIQEMISKSLESKNYDFALRGYIQAIFCSINTFDKELMNKNIERALDLGRRLNKKGEIGIILRLKGYLKVLEGEFNIGERFLKESITVFNSLEDKEKYILNIAAANYYIGESKRFSGEFINAFPYYKKAISLCEKHNLIERLAVFNTSAGQTAYDMGNYKLAEEYLYKALEIYDQLDFQWGRSIANGYMALLAVRRGSYIDAIRYFNRADKYARSLKNSYEIGITYRVKAEACSYIKSQDIKDKNICDYFCKEEKRFCEKAIFYLKNINKCHEIEIMRGLRRVCKEC